MKKRMSKEGEGSRGCGKYRRSNSCSARNSCSMAKEGSEAVGGERGKVRAAGGVEANAAATEEDETDDADEAVERGAAGAVVDEAKSAGAAGKKGESGGSSAGEKL